MKIIYSPDHKKHDPHFEGYDENGTTPSYENAARGESVHAVLQKSDWAEFHKPVDFGMKPIRAVHSEPYLDYLRTAYRDWKPYSPVEEQGFIPGTYGVDYQMSRSLSGYEQSGFFVLDTTVAVTPGTFQASILATHSALTGAQFLTIGDASSFALTRPPGHHAGSEMCGGYCYFNNAAIAAKWLSERGKVAVLDVDYHAGNGTQSIFYERGDVLTISLHADPEKEYPYYAGFTAETGAGAGIGFHRNFPLPPGTDFNRYLFALGQALDMLDQAAPDYLVVSAGMDIFKDDPLGKFDLDQDDIHQIGNKIASLGRPTLVVMEGGYDLPSLGENFVAFLEPFAKLS